MHSEDLKELEQWLQFPIDYAKGINLLSKQSLSPSYRFYAERVADASLRSPDEVSQDVKAYLLSHPNATSSSRPAEPLALSHHAVNTEANRPADQMDAFASNALSRRCRYCHYNQFVERRTRRMTRGGILLCILLLFVALPLALIPIFAMRKDVYEIYCLNCNRRYRG